MSEIIGCVMSELDPDIPTTFKSPAQLLLIDISINKFQKYDHPEITAIFCGPMGGRITEVPLYKHTTTMGLFTSPRDLTSIATISKV